MVALVGCGSQTGSAASAQRQAIERYMGEVEPIRLAVNKLLGGADPILEAFHDRHITPGEAAGRMGQLDAPIEAHCENGSTPTSTGGGRCPAPEPTGPQRQGYLTVSPEALIAYHVPPNDLAPTYEVFPGPLSPM
jgi:hypothetical protein